MYLGIQQGGIDSDGDGMLKEKVRVHILGGLLEIDERRFRLRFNYINPFPAEPDESMSAFPVD